MKLQSSQSRSLRGVQAFTLVEVLVVSVSLIVIIGSVIMCNLFGLAMADRQQIWLGASDDSAQAISVIMTDIHAANTMAVGSISNGGFVTNPATGLQAGSALLIFTNSTATYATGPWTLLYYDSTSNNLVRSNFYGPGLSGDYKLVSANPITNDGTHNIFTELNNDNDVPISNWTTLAPVSIYLSFTKLQDPQIVIEDGSAVDLYQIITVASPRLHL